MIEDEKRRGWRTDDRQLFLLSLPTVIWFVLFCYLPMFGLIIAFKHYQVAPGKGFLWSLLYNSPWTGLDNFRFLFANNAETTFNMFRNTLGYNLIFLVLDIVHSVIKGKEGGSFFGKLWGYLWRSLLYFPLALAVAYAAAYFVKI